MIPFGFLSRATSNFPAVPAPIRMLLYPNGVKENSYKMETITVRSLVQRMYK